MLIMTQDKEALVNLDRADAIEIEPNIVRDENMIEKITWSLQANFYDSNGDILMGAYETGARAKEILQQIADRQGGASTYYMPEE